MTRDDFIIATAIILFVAFVLGWFACWLVGLMGDSSVSATVDPRGTPPAEFEAAALPVCRQGDGEACPRRMVDADEVTTVGAGEGPRDR